MFFTDEERKKYTEYENEFDEYDENVEIPEAIWKNALISRIADNIERLWLDYSSYAPKHFKRYLLNYEYLYQRMWEMYLGVFLLKQGLKIETNINDKGPDFKIKIEDQVCWIEAIVPKAGDGKDRLRGIKSTVGIIPREKFFFRLSSGIDTKFKCFQTYLDDKKVLENDCLIIAISASNLKQLGTLMEKPTPIIFDCLFRELIFYKNTGEKLVFETETHRKLNGMPIAPLFVQKGNEIISAIIYSYEDMLNTTLQQNEIYLIENPNAKNPLPDVFKNKFRLKKNDFKEKAN